MAKKNEKNPGYQTLNAELSSDKPLRPLYLLWGEEDYLREFCLDKIRKRLLPPGLEEMNYFRFDGRNAEIGAIENALETLPVFSEKKLIEVRDFDFYRGKAPDRDALDALLSDLPDYCCLLFVLTAPDFKPDSRMKIHRHFKDPGLSVEFARQSQSDLLSWIRRRFAALGKEINQPTSEYLIFYCGGLMTGLIGEIEKIAAWTKGPEVTRADIDAVGAPILDAVVWKFTDALSNQQFDQAAGVMGELLRMRESPIMILATAGKKFRQMFSARLALEQGRDAAYIKALWGINHDYPARLLMEAARTVDLNWCRAVLLLMAQTDLHMKSTGNRGEDLLIELLLRLSADKSLGRAV